MGGIGCCRTKAHKGVNIEDHLKALNEEEDELKELLNDEKKEEAKLRKKS